MHSPKAPCTDIVTTWALKGLLYHDFGAYVHTIVVLGAFGIVSVMQQGVPCTKLPAWALRPGPYDLI